MRGETLFTEPRQPEVGTQQTNNDGGAQITLRQKGYFTNQKERLQKLLAGDNEAGVLITFAKKEPLTTGVSKSLK